MSAGASVRAAARAEPLALPQTGFIWPKRACTTLRAAFGRFRPCARLVKTVEEKRKFSA